jgi:PAS domain S-box-containing protein
MEALAIADEMLNGELLRSVVDAIPNGVLVLNRDGLIILFNREAERLFGYHSAEVMGQPLEILLPPRHRQNHRKLRELFDGVARPLGAGRLLAGRKKSGAEFPLEIGLSPLETSTGPLVVVSIVDITERQTRIKELHHRVKNNLAVVSSLLSLQATQGVPERARACLEECQRRVLSIALVHEYMYVSESLDRINFADYAQQLVDQLQAAFIDSADRVHVETEFEPILLEMHQTTPCGLILNELVTNAFKHAFPNGRSGVLRIRFRAISDKEILLSVEDNGVGVPEGFRFDAERESLGMLVVSVLAKQLDGNIRLGKGPGARFELRFPAHQ